uniref:Uncharacterized protein n=1 Tax=Rhizophora mucronata TaxID=61149 RepID=A0A2P2L283_RHIMU
MGHGLSFLPFQDKLLADAGDKSRSETESSSDSSSLIFVLTEFFASLENSLPTLASRGVSWSESESYISETSLNPLLSRIARTSAVAFSAFIL